MNKELITVVKQLIDAGCHYDLKRLATLYDKDLMIVILQEDLSCQCFNYDENMQFFSQLKDAGLPPLDTTATFNYADIQNDIGFVSVTRHLDLGFGKKKIIFHLMPKQNAQQWQIFREQAVVVGDVEIENVL